MKKTLLVMHPTVKDNTNTNNNNIFQSSRMSSSLPLIHKSLNLNRQQRLYDYVGSKQFKMNKLIKKQQESNNNKTGRSKQLFPLNNSNNNNNNSIQVQQRNLSSSFNPSTTFNKLASTTINRQTILSKLSNQQSIQITKQQRNIDKFKQYKQFWQQQSDKIRSKLHKKRASLLLSSQNIIIESNPTKNDIINNYVVKYWQMSLRNNNPILLGHIKGNKQYDDVQIQKKIIINEGIQEIQKNIPILPIENIKKLKTKDVKLTGRSKSVKESQCNTERQSESYNNSDMEVSYDINRNSNLSKRYSNVQNQQEVYKINYKGDKKYQGQENLYN